MESNKFRRYDIESLLNSFPGISAPLCFWTPPKEGALDGIVEATATLAGTNGGLGRASAWATAGKIQIEEEDLRYHTVAVLVDGLWKESGLKRPTASVLG